MPAFRFEKKGRIAYLTIDRPETRNAMNREVWAGFVNAWIEVGDNPDIWVAIVTATGDKSFSSGQDLKEMSEWLAAPADKRPPMPLPDRNPMRGDFRHWKPVIAAINGLCIGGGLELALACDIRICADHAKLGLAEVKSGVIPANSGSQKLPRLIPFGKALELLMTGDLIDAKEALHWGLVNKVVPYAQLMAETEALAQHICETAPLAVRAVKELAYRGTEMSLADGYKLEFEIADRLSKSEDSMEGTRSFVEKRKPVWKGR